MKPYVKITIAALVFFMLLNTTYFWEGELGLWAIPVTLGLIVYAVVLAGLFINQLVVAVKEKFTSKGRLVSLLLLLVILLSGYFAPGGLVDFDRLSGKDIFVADRPGSANCLTTLKLKANSTFVQKVVCFGIEDVKGRYVIKNDTLFFTSITPNRQIDSFYKYALLKPHVIIGKDTGVTLVEYYSKNDTTGLTLWLRENNIKDLHVLH